MRRHRYSNRGNESSPGAPRLQPSILLLIFLLVSPGALPELYPLPIRLADAERLHERGVGVGEQVDSEGELVGEISVRGDIVGADTNNFNLGGVEIGLGSRKRLSLDRAAGRVVLRIEVDHEPLTGEIGELGGLAVLLGGSEAGR